jgi:hypothetical protein
MTMKRSKAPRAPLTTEELKHLKRFAPREYERLKLTDEERERVREINKERSQRIAERGIRLRTEGRPIVEDLRAVGLNVESVWDLVNVSTPYPQAIPVLLKHLQLPYSDRTRAGIARALAVPEPEVRKAWPMLVEAYRDAPMGWGIIAPGDTEELVLGAKDGLACTLSASVTDERLPELIALAKDRSLGESRLLLLLALKKRRKKNPLVAQAIEELSFDPDLAKEIGSWDKKPGRAH